MNFNLKPTRVKKFSIGDKVIIQNLTNASLNLYNKAKLAGYGFIHCPCNIKANVTSTIIQTFGNGYLLDTGFFKSVAHPNDLRKV